jgi:hypothetical protein
VNFANQIIPNTCRLYAGAFVQEIHAIPGRAIAVFYDDGASLIRTLRSTDAFGTNGVSDFAPTVITPANFNRVSKPCYDPDSTRWYIMAEGFAAGVAVTEIFESTDGGATWTSVGSFHLDCHSMASVGRELACVASDGRIVYSIDRGRTWFLASRQKQTNPFFYTLAGGGGGFMFWNSGDKRAFSSLARVGDYETPLM